MRTSVLDGKRAAYGAQIVAALRRQLAIRFGRGFDEKSPRHMLRFADVFPDPEIVSALRRQLSWIHFKVRMYVPDPLAREFYAEMCRLDGWSTRALQEKVDRMLYERTALSRKPEKLIRTELAALRTTDRLTTDLVFQDPYRVVEHARRHQRLALALALLAGLRAGEIRGLRRRDVDLRSGLITVRQAICRGVADRPKSGHERVVPIAAALRPLLIESISKTTELDAFVCRTREGNPWSETGIRSALVRAQARAGITGWTLHSLRHVFVTTLFRNGVGAPIVQKLAGHHSLAVTQRYAHADADDLRRAVGTLDRGNSVATTIRAVS